jgi:hypothetical protein
VYRTDYILRIIEQLARTLMAVRSRILGREQPSQEVRAEIHQIARDAGLDLDVARQLDPAMLLGWLAPMGEIDEPRIWLMAELLYLDALEAREGGEPGAGSAGMRRALLLFEQLPPDWKPSDDLTTAGARVAELERLLVP